MLRQQNRNPNKSEGLINKSYKQRVQRQSSITPETTSRINYKPKFIKKHINIQQQCKKIEYPVSIQTIQPPSHTYINSPASFTEQNTIDIDVLHGNKLRWRELYLSTKHELENRTQKFNESIEMFYFILKDMKQNIKDESMTTKIKLQQTEQKINNLLSAFEQFKMNKQY